LKSKIVTDYTIVKRKKVNGDTCKNGEIKMKTLQRITLAILLITSSGNLIAMKGKAVAPKPKATTASATTALQSAFRAKRAQKQVTAMKAQNAKTATKQAKQLESYRVAQLVKPRSKAVKAAHYMGKELKIEPKGFFVTSKTQNQNNPGVKPVFDGTSTGSAGSAGPRISFSNAAGKATYNTITSPYRTAKAALKAPGQAVSGVYHAPGQMAKLAHRAPGQMAKSAVNAYSRLTTGKKSTYDGNFLTGKRSTYDGKFLTGKSGSLRSVANSTLSAAKNTPGRVSQALGGNKNFVTGRTGSLRSAANSTASALYKAPTQMRNVVTGGRTIRDASSNAMRNLLTSKGNKKFTTRKDGEKIVNTTNADGTVTTKTVQKDGRSVRETRDGVNGPITMKQVTTPNTNWMPGRSNKTSKFTKFEGGKPVSGETFNAKGQAIANTTFTQGKSGSVNSVTVAGKYSKNAREGQVIGEMTQTGAPGARVTTKIVYNKHKSSNRDKASTQTVTTEMGSPKNTITQTTKRGKEGKVSTVTSVNSKTGLKTEANHKNNTVTSTTASGQQVTVKADGSYVIKDGKQVTEVSFDSSGQQQVKTYSQSRWTTRSKTLKNESARNAVVNSGSGQKPVLEVNPHTGVVTITTTSQVGPNLIPMSKVSMNPNGTVQTFIKSKSKIDSSGNPVFSTTPVATVTPQGKGFKITETQQLKGSKSNSIVREILPEGMKTKHEAVSQSGARTNFTTKGSITTNPTAAGVKSSSTVKSNKSGAETTVKTSEGSSKLVVERAEKVGTLGVRGKQTKNVELSAKLYEKALKNQNVKEAGKLIDAHTLKELGYTKGSGKAQILKTPEYQAFKKNLIKEFTQDASAKGTITRVKKIKAEKTTNRIAQRNEGQNLSNFQRTQQGPIVQNPASAGPRANSLSANVINKTIGVETSGAFGKVRAATNRQTNVGVQNGKLVIASNSGRVLNLLTGKFQTPSNRLSLKSKPKNESTSVNGDGVTTTITFAKNGKTPVSKTVRQPDGSVAVFKANSKGVMQKNPTTTVKVNKDGSMVATTTTKSYFKKSPTTSVVKISADGVVQPIQNTNNNIANSGATQTTVPVQGRAQVRSTAAQQQQVTAATAIQAAFRGRKSAPAMKQARLEVKQARLKSVRESVVKNQDGMKVQPVAGPVSIAPTATAVTAIPGSTGLHTPGQPVISPFKLSPTGQPAAGFRPTAQAFARQNTPVNGLPV